MTKKSDAEMHKRLDRLSSILLCVAFVCTALALLLIIFDVK
jgi:cytochrome c-type biogenesis protein CcmE